IDIESEGKTISQQTLDKLHSLKTGALIRGAVAMGCLSANADAFTAECSDRFAEKLGLIFQIVDDILDITASPEELGKSVGSDAENEKTTYATLFGIEKSKDIVSLLASQAKSEIIKLDADCNFLCDLIDNMAVRTN
ncbi:MAG: polyprenyl synthetase family protein, partial [Angelakisella sp.]